MNALRHLLNIADWALMLAGVAAALVMMVVGSDDERRSGGKAVSPQGERRQSGKITSSADRAS
jgi:hypothetical protein